MWKVVFQSQKNLLRVSLAKFMYFKINISQCGSCFFIICGVVEIRAWDWSHRLKKLMFWEYYLHMCQDLILVYQDIKCNKFWKQMWLASLLRPDFGKEGPLWYCSIKSIILGTHFVLTGQIKLSLLHLVLTKAVRVISIFYFHSDTLLK